MPRKISTILRSLRLAGSAFIAISIALHGVGRSDEHLRNYVFMVKPSYHPETRQFLGDLANLVDKSRNGEMAEYLRSYTQGGYGTGFLIRTANNRLYVVTNRHIVDQADKVAIIKTNSNGENRTFENCQIVFTSDDADVAILEIPGADKYFQDALEFDAYNVYPEKTKVVAVGFAGLGNSPGWKLDTGMVVGENVTTPGIVSNPHYPVIQHTAPVSPGNSGGPLLIRNPKSKSGYSVIGINTLKAMRKENTHYAVPSWVLEGILTKLEGMEQTMRNHEKLVQDLENKCKSLAFEFSSEHPHYESLFRLISNEFVSKRGPEGYLNMTKLSDELDWNSQLLADPLRTMKLALFMNMIYEVKSLNKSSQVTYEKMNSEDLKYAYVENGVRTVFALDNQSHREIVWKMEFGEWKIADFKLTEIQSAKPLAAGKRSRSGIDTSSMQDTGAIEVSHAESPGELIAQKLPMQRLLVSLHLEGLLSNTFGNAYNHVELNSKSYNEKGGVSGAVAVMLQEPISPVFALASGLRLFTQSVAFNHDGILEDGTTAKGAWIRDDLVVLQVPALTRINLNGFSLGGGLGLNCLLLKNRMVSSGNSVTNRPAITYANYSMPLLVDMDYTIGMGSRYRIGLGCGYEYPLLAMSKPQYHSAKIGSGRLGLVFGRAF